MPLFANALNTARLEHSVLFMRFKSVLMVFLKICEKKLAARFFVRVAVFETLQFCVPIISLPDVTEVIFIVEIVI